MPAEKDIAGVTYGKTIPYGEDALPGNFRDSARTGSRYPVVDAQGRLYVVPEELLEDILTALHHVAALLEDIAE